MTRMHRNLTLAIGLLLALPAASAIPTSFAATAVRAVGPDPGVASGDVAVFLLEDLSQAGGDAPPVPPFTVEAQALHVTTDYSDLAVRNPTPVGIRPNVQSDETNYGVSSLEETGNREGYRVDISKSLNHPAPLASLTNGCFEAGATDKESVNRTSIVDASRKPMAVPLGDGILFTSCGLIQPTLAVTGSFVLHVWQTDLLLREGGRSQALQSGHMPSSGLPPSSVPVDQGRDQELFIEVINGTLRTPFTPEGRLYLRGMDASLDGEVVLNHARGTLETETGSIRIEDQNLRLRGGPMHITAKGHGQNPMDVTMDGGWREATLGTMVLAAAEAPSHASAAAPFALGIVALAALAASRRRR